MIQTTRKTNKKVIEKDLETLIKEQQEIIDAQQKQLLIQEENIQLLQNAIDDIILMQMNL